MSFKVVFREETKRIPSIPTSFSGLKDCISKAFGNKIPSETVTKYVDLDGDLITVNSEDDYKVMIDLLKNQIKVFVLPHDATVTTEVMKSSVLSQTSEKKSSEEIILLDSPKSEAAKSVEIPAKVEKVVEKDPKRLAVEEQIRKKLEKKAEEKAKRKIELKKAKKAMFEAMGQLMSKAREMLDVKAQLLECKKKATECEDEKSEVNCEFDEEKMELKVAKEVIMLEIKDLQVSVDELKKSVRSLQGKKPKKTDGKKPVHCSKKVTFAAKPQVIHPRVTCDGCGVHPMVGVRYKCTICHDFDFCEKCEATKPHPHAWIKIDHPSKAPRFLFAVDAQPEYENDLSVHGDKGLANLLAGVEPVLNQFLSPEEVQQKLAEIKREIAPETISTSPEFTETIDTEIRITEEPMMKPVAENLSEVSAEPVPLVEPVEVVEEKAVDPIETRVKFLHEIFSDIPVEQMVEIVKSNEFKTDEEIINQLLSKWN